MNVERLEQRLFEKARQAGKPSDAVPYAFEQRIMARLKGSVVENAWSLWGRGLWRAATATTLLALALCGWSYWHGTNSHYQSATLEDAVFADADQFSDTW